MIGQMPRTKPAWRRALYAACFAAARCARVYSARRSLGLLLLASFSSVLSSPAGGIGTRRYVIDVLPSEQDLPQNTITGITQTPDGYLWITTLDGVARFDGVRFRMFRAANTPALGSGRIRFLLVSRGGELWLATQEGGVVQLREGHFVPVALPDLAGPRSAIVQVVRDDANALWFSSEDGRVIRWSEGRYSVVSTNWQTAGQVGFQLRADHRNRLWVVTTTGLYQLRGESLVPSLVGKPGQYLIHCPSRTGGWWLSSDGQVRLWREGQWVGEAGRLDIATEAFACALEDHSGGLWLGTAGQGLFRCETNRSPIHFTKADGLNSNLVRTLFEDTEGNLWVGTEDAGLNRVRLSLFTVFGLAQGLSSERVTTVSEDRAGRIWVGTDGAGVNCLQGKTAWTVGEAALAASWRVSAVLADREGRVWATLRSGGVYYWREGTFSQLTGFATERVPARSLFEDSCGAVWIGQRNTRTLTRVQSNQVETIHLPQTLPPVDVRVMAEDAEGTLWFGTDGAGLLQWRGGQFTRFTRENGLSSDFIWALHPEPDGTLWIGTYGGGLTRLKGGRTVPCTTRHGLVDDVICHIIDAGRGQYWFSSNQGIFRVDKAELNEFAEGKRTRIQCVAYGRSDGLPSLECEGGCQPAGCRSRDGQLWFPTIRGLVMVNPADVSTNTVPPPVHIEKIVVDGITTETSQWQRATAAPPSPGASKLRPVSRASLFGLEIGPSARRLEFHYTALNFSAPEKLRFRHRLEGVDAEWVDTGGQREASYNQLSHGTYTFRVQACNREGVWNLAGDQLTFTVLPHFWQTGWFTGLFLVAFGSTIGWGVRHVLRRRHQRQLERVEQLHALERERTRIARDIHDDLGGSLTEIGYLGALAVRDSQSLADAREQIVRIMQRTQELARRLDETVWAVNPKNDSLGHLATYICYFAREFLEPTGIRCRIELAPDLPEVPLTTEVRHSVFLVVKEALNNAVKHSAATELRLRLALRDNVMIIEVRDNGKGFVRAAGSGGPGNGLRNMATRMEEIGGQFQVNSMPGLGTSVCLHLPLRRRENNPRRSGPRPIQLRDSHKVPRA